MIQNLPINIIYIISKYLDFKSYVFVSNFVCQQWHDVFTRSYSDLVWSYFLDKDFSFRSDQCWAGWTLNNVYRLLYTYRFILGYWKRSGTCYGGLFKIVADKTGIVGYECLPPYITDVNVIAHLADSNLIDLLPGAAANVNADEETRHKIRFYKIFSLRPSPFGGMRILCFQSVDSLLDDTWHSPCSNALQKDHTCSDLCQAAFGFISKLRDGGFTFVCHHSEKHKSLQDYNYLFIRDIGFSTKDNNKVSLLSILHQIDEFYDVRCHVRKMHMLARLSGSYELKEIDLNYSDYKDPPAGLQPGLFYGTYGVHGLEILNFSYNDNCDKLIGTKITGDPNIPAGQVSIEIDLTVPLNFNKHQQHDLDELIAAFEEQKRNPSENCLAVQPFLIPDGFETRTDHYPEYCVKRFAAKGQVAHDNYSHPSFIDAIWTLFDENTFGVLWLEILSFSMYYRIKNL